MTDAVRYVAEQKFLSSRHAKIADHQDIDGFLLNGADDRQCRIGIKNDQGMTALPGDLLAKYASSLLAVATRVCSAAPNSVVDGYCGTTTCTTIQFCIVAVGEPGGPVDGPVGSFGAVGADHHAPYGVTLQRIVHKVGTLRKNSIGITGSLTLAE